MSHEFVMGFFSNNEPAWHGLGKVLPAGEWPGKEEAMRLAGHDWKVVEHTVSADIGGVPTPLENHKALFRADSGECLSVMNKTYAVIQNDVPYDMIEAVAKEGIKWHCGITLLGGKCVVVGYLPEQWTAPGDNSPTMPFLTAVWSHDGTTSLKVIRTAIRVVCANTRAMALGDAAKTGLEVTVRHSKNWRDYVERARIVLRQTREAFNEYKHLAADLAGIAVKQENVETFLKAFLPMPDLAKVQYSDRVERNVNQARLEVKGILAGPTTSDQHRSTAYGLWQAGLEYLQHTRKTKTSHSKLNRCILSEDRMAENLHRLVISCAK